jgi:N-carbamoylputrescine amidase
MIKDTRGQIKIAALQCGPSTEDKKLNLKKDLELLDKAAEERPDFVIFSEASLFPNFWCAPHDNKYFNWAEPVPGPTTSLIAERARGYGSYILIPLYEKGKIEGEYYNSVAVVGPEGDLIYGTLPGGREVPCYRKNHIPSLLMEQEKIFADEKYYFRPGPGFPVFKTKQGNIGILICYDRTFSEAWRVLALQGAEIIFVPLASAGWREEGFIFELRTRALENAVFVVACSKGGKERFEGKEIPFFGNSCIINPFGDIMAQGPAGEGPAIITALIDLAQVSQARKQLPIFRDRRPEIYGPILRDLSLSM